MCSVCLSDIKQIWSFISERGSASSASATLNRRSASMWMRLETPSVDVPYNGYVIVHCLSCFSLHLFPSSFSHSIFNNFSIIVSFVLPLCSTQFADTLKLGYNMFTYFTSGVTQCPIHHNFNFTCLLWVGPTARKKYPILPPVSSPATKLTVNVTP
jgi:hypothetical protein